MSDKPLISETRLSHTLKNHPGFAEYLKTRSGSFFIMPEPFRHFGGGAVSGVDNTAFHLNEADLDALAKHTIALNDVSIDAATAETHQLGILKILLPNAKYGSPAMKELANDSIAKSFARQFLIDSIDAGKLDTVKLGSRVDAITKELAAHGVDSKRMTAQIKQIVSNAPVDALSRINTLIGFRKSMSTDIHAAFEQLVSDKHLTLEQLKDVGIDDAFMQRLKDGTISLSDRPILEEAFSKYSKLEGVPEKPIASFKTLIQSLEGERVQEGYIRALGQDEHVFERLRAIRADYGVELPDTHYEGVKICDKTKAFLTGNEELGKAASEESWVNKISKSIREKPGRAAAIAAGAAVVIGGGAWALSEMGKRQENENKPKELGA